MHAAIRAAWRGHGYVEPNPMVGCVITNATGDVIGIGHHERFGQAHAEVNALRQAGMAARNGTAYITLEPCHHHGKTPPCSAALIDAGIRRVVIGQRDPHIDAQGGAEALRRADIDVHFPYADDNEFFPFWPAEPFVYRVTSGLPFIIAKWAQSIDGRIATRTGESQWLSGASSRALVHRQRGRVDAILTGIGTVLRDDPLLTARHVRIRRRARRIILDPGLRTPVDCRLTQSCDIAPVTLVCTNDAEAQRSDHADALREAGVEIIAFADTDGRFDLRELLSFLSRRHDITTMLTEAGPAVMSQLAKAKLIRLAWVFTGPKYIADESAPAAMNGFGSPELGSAMSYRLVSLRRRDHDVVAMYRPRTAGIHT